MSHSDKRSVQSDGWLSHTGMDFYKWFNSVVNCIGQVSFVIQVFGGTSHSSHPLALLFIYRDNIDTEMNCRLLLNSGGSSGWLDKLLQIFHRSSVDTVASDGSEGSHRTVHDDLANDDMRTIHNNMTMTTVIGSLSPQKAVIATRTLPYNNASHARNIIGTKFGTATRLFTNPLDNSNSRPDIIYHHPHHYDDHLSDNVYETISHCKNLKNSVI